MKSKNVCNLVPVLLELPEYLGADTVLQQDVLIQSNDVQDGVKMASR